MGRTRSTSKRRSEIDNQPDYIPCKKQSRTKKNKCSQDEEHNSKVILMKYFNDTIPEKEVRSLFPPEVAEEYLMFVRQCSEGKQSSDGMDGQDEKTSRKKSQTKQTSEKGHSSTEHKENMPMDESDEDNSDQSHSDTRKKQRRPKKPTKTLLKCLLCNKVCQSKSEKQAHYNDHLSKRGYECTHCCKAFDKMPALVSHVSRVHLINKGLSCKVCGQAFRREWLLRSHSRTHTSGRKFSCPVCKRGFIRKRDLFDHISGHVNYNPYKCDECGKRFQMSSYLSLHRKIHFAVRPFKCEFCDVHCLNYSDVKTHALLHDEDIGVDCLECNVRVSSNRYALHVISHNRKKNFKCTLCPAKFYAKSTLRYHMKAHKLIKEYKCDVCETAMQTAAECSSHVCSKWTDEIYQMCVKKSKVARNQSAPQPKCNGEELSADHERLWTDSEDIVTNNSLTNFSSHNEDSESQPESDNFSLSDDSSSSCDDGSPVFKRSSSSSPALLKSETSEHCNEPLNLNNDLFHHIGLVQSDIEEDDEESD